MESKYLHILSINVKEFNSIDEIYGLINAIKFHTLFLFAEFITEDKF